jgi:para-nitrobenzyl esterase
MRSLSSLHAVLSRVLLSTLLAALAPAASLAQDVPESAAPVVTIESGRIEGQSASALPDVTLYRGIPFARAPLGPLRWREPQPPGRWDGVRKPLDAVPGCMQLPYSDELPWTAEFMHQGPVSEDCLFLNVWTPARAPDAPLPVLVYIHGGAFREGSIAAQIFDGAALAHRGAVLVEANYRLGVLGFMAHPQLTRESSHHSSGNYGLLDQVAALRWVQDNIAAFGGDPRRVTIFGQSSGAMSVYLLTASPLARGLFQRAIVQSGPGALAAVGVPSIAEMTHSREEREKEGLRLAALFRMKSVAQLRTLDARRLVSPRVRRHVRPIHFGPAIDGWFLPADAEEIYARHQQNDVAMIIGTMADEGSAAEGYNAARAARVLEAGIAGIDQVLTQRTASGSPVAYAYLFNRAVPWPEHPEFGAFHAGDLPYVFDNLRLLDRPWTEVDRTLAAATASYWINFAATGDPNGPGLPRWNPYQPGSRSFMVLDDNIGERTLAR